MTSTGSGRSGPRTTAPGDKFGLRVSSVMPPHVSSCSSLAGRARAASGSALGVRPAILPERPLCLWHPREPAYPGGPSGGAKPARALVCRWCRQAPQGRAKLDRDEPSGCQRLTARHRLPRGCVAAQRIRVRQVKCRARGHTHRAGSLTANRSIREGDTAEMVRGRIGRRSPLRRQAGPRIGGARDDELDRDRTRLADDDHGAHNDRCNARGAGLCRRSDRARARRSRPSNRGRL